MNRQKDIERAIATARLHRTAAKVGGTATCACTACGWVTAVTRKTPGPVPPCPIDPADLPPPALRPRLDPADLAGFVVVGTIFAVGAAWLLALALR